MEYLFLPKDIENNRDEEVRVVDGWEVDDDKHKFVIQTKIVVGGMATVKPDWVTVAGFTELKDAIAYIFRFFPPYTIEKPLTIDEVKQQLRENNGLIKTNICVDNEIIYHNPINYLNDVIDYGILDDKLQEHEVYLIASKCEIIGVEPLYNDLILSIECKVSDKNGFLKD